MEVRPDRLLTAQATYRLYVCQAPDLDRELWLTEAKEWDTEWSVPHLLICLDRSPGRADALRSCLR